MFIDIDYNKRKKGYRISLAKPNKQVISNISEAYGLNYNVKLGSVNELTFSVPYYIDMLDERIKNDNIELIKERMYLKILYNGSEEWLVIDSIEDAGANEEKHMNVTAFTNVYENSNRRISELNLEVVNPEEYYSAILNDTSWSIGLIDPLFKDIYRTVELNDVTVLEAIMTGAETYGAVLDFDTVNKKINLLDFDSRARYRGLHINYSNFLQSVSRKRTSDEMATRMYVYGAEGISIEKMNPTGMNYLEDFSYFLYPFERDDNKNVVRSSYYMSDELSHAILDINELSRQYQPIIKELQDEIDEETSNYVEEATLLEEIRFDEVTVSGLLDIAKATEQSSLIEQRRSELEAIKSQRKIKELTVEHISAIIEDRERQISHLQSQITVTSFTEELYDELTMYIIEKEFRDDRYIDAGELYRDAKNKFEESKLPSVAVEASIDNIVDSLEEDYYSDKVVLGDIARITDKEMKIDMKSLITEMSFDLDSSVCTITIANTDIEKDGYDRILSVLYDTQSTTTMLENNKYKWDTVTDVKTEVDLMRDSEIDATRNRIKAGFRESVTIEDRGIILSNPDFPDEIVIMQAGVIALSTDGGENWSTSITPRGVVADTLIGKLVASSNLIVTNDSGSFRIDGDGMTVDMDSIKITSGEGDTPENIIDSWNAMLVTMDEFADDGTLNEYEKNQIEKQWNSIKISHSSMVKVIQDVLGPETIDNPYPVEYDDYMESYERLRKFLEEEIQVDGHTILDPLNRKETTTIDGGKYNGLISNYEVDKDRFQTVIPMEYSQTAIQQTREEIEMNYVRNGEIVTRLNLSKEGIKIDGELLEINSDTEFNKNLTMNAGLILSADGAISIDLNEGLINLGRPLTINAVPVVTTDDLDSVESTLVQRNDEISSEVSSIDGRVTTQSQTLESISSTIYDPNGRLSVIERTADGVHSAVFNSDGSSKITQLQNNIGFLVKKGDLLSQINLEAGRVLIESDKILLNASNTVITGTAWMEGSVIKDATIGSAKIESLSVNKLNGNITNFIESYWNSAVGGGVSISASTGVRTRASSGEETRLEYGGIGFYDRTGWYRGRVDSSYSNDGVGGLSIFIQNGSHFSIVRESGGSYSPILWLEGYSNIIQMNTNIGFKGNRIVDIQSMRFSGGNATVRRQGTNNVEITTHGENNTAVLFGQTTAQFYRGIDMNGNSITNQSDIRLKANVEDSKLNALGEIERLRFIEWDWDREKSINRGKPTERQFGLIAQYTPFLQTKAGESESYLSIDLTKQINLNSKATQEMLSYVKELEKRIEELERGE